MATNHVVVDGSNLATEGRTTPSLAQLEEAVASYLEEHPDTDVVVVVDATFEHRMDTKDRDRLKEAELNGEVVAPPAGTVGRGDAFILRIAKRTGGIVLSNDSFQEFHGEHPWLFEEGRLVGGKPVPGVGWIFTPRNPVRGPKSRAATAATRRNAPAKVPAAKLGLTRPDGSKPKVGDTATPTLIVGASAEPMRAYALAKELGLDTKGLKELASLVKVSFPSHSSTLTAEQVTKVRAKASEPPPVEKIRAYALAKELGLENKALKDVAAGVGIVVASHSSTIEGPDADAIRDAVANPAPEPNARRPRRRGGRRGGGGGDSSTKAESDSTPSKDTSAEKRPGRGTKAKASGGTKAAAATKATKSKATKDDSANEPLALVSFVANHGIGSEVDGVVASFTSHGAMVDVEISDGTIFHCYAPKERLGSPPPAKARDVLSRSEQRRFKVVAIDTARRMAELELI